MSMGLPLCSILLMGIVRVLEYRITTLCADVRRLVCTTHYGLTRAHTLATPPHGQKDARDITHQLVEIAQSLEYAPSRDVWTQFEPERCPSTPPNSTSTSSWTYTELPRRTSTAARVSTGSVPVESSPPRHTAPAAWTSPPADIPSLSSPSIRHTSDMLQDARPILHSPSMDVDMDHSNMFDISSEVLGCESNMMRKNIRLRDIPEQVEIPRPAQHHPNPPKRIRLCLNDRVTTLLEYPCPRKVDPHFVPRAGFLHVEALHRLCSSTLTRVAMQ